MMCANLPCLPHHGRVYILKPQAQISLSILHLFCQVFFFHKDKNSNVQVKGNHVLPREGQTRVGPRRLGQDLLSTVKTNEGQESRWDLRELGESSQILFLQMKDDKRHN